MRSGGGRIAHETTKSDRSTLHRSDASIDVENVQTAIAPRPECRTGRRRLNSPAQKCCLRRCDPAGEPMATFQ